MFLARQRLLATLLGALTFLALLVCAEPSFGNFPAAESLPKKIYDTIARSFGSSGSSNNQQVLDGGAAHEEFSTMDWSQYEGDMVLRFNFTSPREKKAFIRAAEVLVLDVWKLSKASADVRISRSRYHDFLRILPKSLRKSTSHSVMIEDLQHAVISTFPMANNEMQVTKESDIHTTAEMFFKDYRDLDTIYDWLDLLASTYPSYVSLEVIGQTAEGRDLKAVHIHSRSSFDEKKTVVVTSGLHAREWISVSSALYAVFQLVTNNDKHQEGTLLDQLDFLFVPVMNPDGYVYSWEHDRLWRKNRQDTGFALCRGIDLDHSFNFHWQPSTGTPCSESYAGSRAHEALEVYHFSHYINKTKSEGHKYYGYLDWHSYSQSILYPYAYSCDAEPRDEENLLELAYGLAKTIRWTSGKHFEVLPACQDRDGFYSPDVEGSGGSALDFMYNIHAIWAFQIKLRDTGNYGFLMPKKYILPVAKEMYNSFKYFSDFILNPE
ncbi:hypothetical protein D0Z00_004060 [Geotrichum galactomycetum]|uniref:Uncharacterized protein n=1 Tax=Geotrichum galactomycetum TaxID=27317 RepID=A0ACB6UZJ9_9ASCO|nr:hypothetical protein D0Z00_004060 [Geotrichum candidum]